MVAGPACSKFLPQDPPPPSVTLVLHDLTQEEDEQDFVKLHAQYRPSFKDKTPRRPGYNPRAAPCHIQRLSARCSVFFVQVGCPCGQPLKIAVQSTPDCITQFEQLLRGPLDLLCPHCASRCYGR
uniref:Protein E7 n=1 Tax=Epsilonpapillomavirus 1 TaxID=40537 RepID=A0A165XUZ2_9PAPI|nr:E7 [Epsilonpapillomavirus 1]